MERVKRSLFLDPIDKIDEFLPDDILSMSNLQLLDEDPDEDDNQFDINVLENLIFSDTERTYNALDDHISRTVHEAIRETLSENSATDKSKIECSHCNEIFNNATFQMHVCQYDANHQLIPITMLAEEENDFEKFARISRELLERNQSLIKGMVCHGKSKPEGVQCAKCCRKFVHETGLMRHYEKHIGELLEESPHENGDVMMAVILCLVCGAVSGDPAEAWNHLQSYHIESSQPSSEHMLFRNQRVIPKFVKIVLLSKVYQCEFCELTFVSAKMVLFHEAKHDPSCRFSCNLCELKDLSLKDILLHRRDECILFIDIRNRLRDFPRAWICNTCDFEFRGLEQLIKHRYDEFHFYPRVTARSNKLRFPCERCKQVFKTAQDLVDHVNEKYQKKGNAGANIGSTSDRIEHSPTHPRKGGIHQTSTRPRQYLCEVCGKSYTQSSHLWQHLRFHQGIKPFACDVEGCGRKFTIRPDLNDHVRKCHTGERPYLCTICDKRFLTGSVFYQHRLIHRGERRYGCEECGKRFYRADALKNHERIHTGEKPHTCYECGKKFRQRGDRDKHVKSRHPGADVVVSPRKERIKSFGRGRVKNNTSLYCSMPPST